MSREVKCGALGLSKSGRKADLVARGHMKTLRMDGLQARLEAAASQEAPQTCLAGE